MRFWFGRAIFGKPSCRHRWKVEEEKEWSVIVDGCDVVSILPSKFRRIVGRDQIGEWIVTRIRGLVKRHQVGIAAQMVLDGVFFLLGERAFFSQHDYGKAVFVQISFGD